MDLQGCSDCLGCNKAEVNEGNVVAPRLCEWRGTHSDPLDGPKMWLAAMATQRIKCTASDLHPSFGG